MSNVFTLDSLNDELEIKYGSFEFQAGKQKFVLPPILRLPKSERDLAYAILANTEAVQESQDIDAFQMLLEELLKVLVRDGKGDQLIEVLDHDILKMQILIEKWTEKTQPGEA
jgi:hypothetical protein